MIRLLRTERRLCWFLLGGILLTLGGSASLVALPLFVLTTTSNALLLGSILLARTLPATLLAPFFGRYIDRVGIYRAAIVGLLLSALGSGMVPLLAGLPPLIAGCAFIQGVGQILLFPVVACYLPALVSKQDLDMANSAFRTFSIAGGLAGTALGGLLITARLSPLVFGLDALLALLTLGAVLMIGRLPGTATQDEQLPLWRAFVPVVQVVRQNPTLLSLLAIDAALYLAVGATGVALPLYTTALAHAPWLYSSTLLIANGAELLGGVLAPHVNRRVPPGRLALAYGLLALTMGLSFLAISAWISAASVLLFTLLTSLLLGVLYVLYRTYMQKAVPASLMGSFQTGAASLSALCQGGGNVAAGVIATRSFTLPYTMIGGAVLLSSAFTLLVRQRSKPGTPPVLSSQGGPLCRRRPRPRASR